MKISQGFKSALAFSAYLDSSGINARIKEYVWCSVILNLILNVSLTATNAGRVKRVLVSLRDRTSRPKWPSVNQRLTRRFLRPQNFMVVLLIHVLQRMNPPTSSFVPLLCLIHRVTSPSAWDLCPAGTVFKCALRTHEWTVQWIQLIQLTFELSRDVCFNMKTTVRALGRRVWGKSNRRPL